MIERLLSSLRDLATATDPHTVKDLAADFDDALLLVRSCQQLQLSDDQDRALAEVEALLAGNESASRPRLQRAAQVALAALTHGS